MTGAGCGYHSDPLGAWVLYGDAKHVLEQRDAELAALEAKFDSCPHVDPECKLCGCSYDKPSDVCAVHAPQLREALEQIAALKQQVERLSAPVSEQQATGMWMPEWIRVKINALIESRLNPPAGAGEQR
jgi:hypothetical protein